MTWKVRGGAGGCGARAMQLELLHSLHADSREWRIIYSCSTLNPGITLTALRVVPSAPLCPTPLLRAGSALAEPPSVDRRNQAIKLLQAANPGLTVSYTLPVLPAGLTADGVYLIQSAVKYGARVDVVNLMTMDFGDSAAPAADGRMGTFAIWAAGNTSAQATAAGMTTKVRVRGAGRRFEGCWGAVGASR